MKALIGTVVASVALAAVASSAQASPTYPSFQSLPSIIAGIVGYQIPVACEPALTKGTVIGGLTLTISYQGRQQTYTPQFPPVLDNEAGVTLFFSVIPGAVVTASYGGQAATLPTVPATTPETQEAITSPFVAIPVAIALDLSVCNIWSATQDFLCGACGINDHGSALLVAIHEAMHAKYAEGNEALTECRAMQAFPDSLSSLFSTLVDPGNEPAEPIKPVVPHESRVWKAKHPVLWKKHQGQYTAAYARWQATYRQWKSMDAGWSATNEIWVNQASAKSAMVGGATFLDAALPAAYHGGSC